MRSSSHGGSVEEPASTDASSGVGSSAAPRDEAADAPSWSIVRSSDASNEHELLRQVLRAQQEQQELLVEMRSRLGCLYAALVLAAFGILLLPVVWAIMNLA